MADARYRRGNWTIGTSAAFILGMAVFDAAAANGDRGRAATNGTEVVVTAGRIERGVDDTPASVDVIDRGDIERAAPISVDALLRTVAGADVQGSGVPGAAIRFNLRGLTPGYQSHRVLVLMDGRRLHDSYQGNAELALMHADGLRRIEIVRGPASALYGSAAMGGVVQLFSNRGFDMLATPGDGTGTRLRWAGGSHGTLHGLVEHGGVYGRTDFLVAASGVHTDGYIANQDGSRRRWDAFSGRGNAGYRLAPDAELRLFSGLYGAEGQSDNGFRRVRQNFQQIDFNWDWDATAEARLTARAYRNAERNTYHWIFPGSGFYDLQTLAGEVQQSLWWGERQRMVGGVEWRHESVAINEVAGPIEEAQFDAGVYVQDDIQLTDLLTARAGLRFDRFGAQGGAWSPRLGLIARIGRQGETYAAVSRAHRAPSLANRFVRTEFDGALFEGNPDLDPETLTAFEGGVRLRERGVWSFQAAVFRNELKDSFDFSRDPDGVFRIRNVTESFSQGFEAALQRTIVDGVDVFANYAYTEGEYRVARAHPAIEGNRLAYLAPHKAAAGLDLTWGPLDQRLAFRYVSRRFGDEANSDANAMGDFVTVDWRGRYRLSPGLDVTLNVDNLLDREYREFPAYPQPGLSVLAGLESRF